MNDSYPNALWSGLLEVRSSMSGSGQYREKDWDVQGFAVGSVKYLSLPI